MEEAPVATTAQRSKAFTEQGLKDEWDRFLKKMEAAGRHQEVIILKEPYDLNDSEIVLSIPNEALVSTFERVKSELLVSLRDGLGNDSLTLRSVVKEIDKSKMLYTDKEKFEHLKKKFPALKDLQEKLGLDPEF